MNNDDFAFIEKLTTNITQAMVSGIKSELTGLSKSIDKQSQSIEKLVANDIRKGEQLEEVKRHAFERIDVLESEAKKLKEEFSEFQKATQIAEAVQETRMGTWQKWWDMIIKISIPIILSSSFLGMIYYVSTQLPKS